MILPELLAELAAGSFDSWNNMFSLKEKLTQTLVFRCEYLEDIFSKMSKANLSSQEKQSAVFVAKC